MRWRRTRCNHGLLLAELEALKVTNAKQATENARLKVTLAPLLILQWMHAAIVQRDRQAKAEQQRERRLQLISDEPTGVYATEVMRRTR